VLKEAVIGVTTHTFRADLQGSEWYCGLDQAQAWHYSTAYMGFSSGARLLAQGETDSLWSQIGKLAVGIPPDKLLLDQMQYKSGSWQTLAIGAIDVCCVSGDDSHYGVSKPAAGSLKNWTIP